MDGVHDMGGMHGFGPVDTNDDGVLFPNEWESRVLATNLAMSIHLGNNVDRFRFRIESMPPAEYLAASYYERWLASMLSGIEELGLLNDGELAEIRAGRCPDVTPAETAALAPDIAAVMVNAPAGKQRDMSGSPAFTVGQQVRARAMHRAGHTRMPRYVRGCTGTIVSDNGNQLLPDTHSDSGKEVMERLYTVRFSSSDIWGDTASPRDSVCVDLWESYLEGH